LYKIFLSKTHLIIFLQSKRRLVKLLSQAAEALIDYAVFFSSLNTVSEVF
jgi:hypothetical protein